MTGAGCDTPHYVPDVFLMSIVLFLGTFIISVQLKDFKNALFFPSKVSNIRYSIKIILNLA
jgi:sodium bicarbonate transporter 10